MKYLLGLAVLMAPLSTFAAEDLTISLSDVKEDTHNSEYLSFDVVELEFLVNRHAIEIAVNPINQDIYIELDFLALKESQKDQKIDNTNALLLPLLVSHRASQPMIRAPVAYFGYYCILSITCLIV